MTASEDAARFHLHPHPRLHIALSILRATPPQTSSSGPANDFTHPFLHVFDRITVL
jgi:hypothetical protein